MSGWPRRILTACGAGLVITAVVWFTDGGPAAADHGGPDIVRPPITRSEMCELDEDEPRPDPTVWGSDDPMITCFFGGGDMQVCCKPWRVFTCHNMGHPESTGLVVDECWGAYPTANYDIGYHGGGRFDIARKLWGLGITFLFDIGKYLAMTAFWLVGWGYDWEAENVFGMAGNELAHRLDRGIVDGWGLYDKVWFAVVAWAGFTAVRGRLSNVGGELLLSALLAMLGWMLINNLHGYRQDALDTLRSVAVAPLSVIEGDTVDILDEPADDEEMEQRLRTGLLGPLHHAFVEVPYDYINWGESLDGHACEPFRDDVVASGPWSQRRHTGADARDHFKEGQYGTDADDDADADVGARCLEFHQFNEEPSGTRLFSALLYVVATAVLLVLMMLVALTVVLMKMLVVLLFAFAPVVAPLATLPGAGRRLAWSWLASLGRACLGVAGVGFVLSILLLTMRALLASGTGNGVIARFVMVDLLLVAMILARKRVLAATSNFTQRMANRLTTTPAGGTHIASWMAGPGGVGAGGGGGLAAAMGGSESMAQPVVAYGRSKVDNLQARRRASRASGYALRKQERWKYNNGLTHEPVPGLAQRAVNRTKDSMPVRTARGVGRAPVRAGRTGLGVLRRGGAAGRGAYDTLRHPGDTVNRFREGTGQVRQGFRDSLRQRREGRWARRDDAAAARQGRKERLSQARAARRAPRPQPDPPRNRDPVQEPRNPVRQAWRRVRRADERDRFLQGRRSGREWM